MELQWKKVNIPWSGYNHDENGDVAFEAQSYIVGNRQESVLKESHVFIRWIKDFPSSLFGYLKDHGLKRYRRGEGGD